MGTRTRAATSVTIDGERVGREARGWMTYLECGSLLVWATLIWVTNKHEDGTYAGERGVF